MKQPAWATKLITRICEEKGLKIPTTKWIRNQRLSSSGRYRYADKQITIQAGTDPIDQRVVFLHEVAHYINGEVHGGRPGHDTKFWDIAFELFYDKRNRVKRKYALQRSTSYKSKAATAYARMKAGK